MIFLGIDLALSTLGQTLGIGLCLLHLAPQVLPLCFQIRDGPLMDTQLVGKWEKFFKKGLSLITADLGDMINVFQNGPEITPRVKQTAGSTEKYQQYQQPADLQPALQQEVSVIAFGDQHRENMRFHVPVGGHEGPGQAHEGQLRSGVGG